MNFFKQIVYSNIWISIGASVYTYTTYRILNISVNYLFLILVFFSTLFAYNLQRVLRIESFEKNGTPRQEWIYNRLVLLKWITGLSFFITVGIAIYIFSINDYFHLVLPFLIVLLYASLFFFSKKKKGLRDIPLLKIFLISFVWAYVLGVFPVKDQGINLWAVFIDKFCYIMAITIPFDIRDMYVDSENKTLPQVTGVRASKVLAIALIGISAFLQRHYLHLNIGVGFFTFYLITLIAIIFSNPKRPDIYFSGFVDGLLVISFICLL